MQIVRRLSALLAFGTLALAVGQRPEQPTPPVMIAAVARDLSALAGGIGSGNRTKSGTVGVEPVAFLTESGAWQAIPCKSGSGEGCEKFAREYLSKRHTYTVISSDGMGATVRTAPVTLSECYGYAGDGTYTGARITNSAIAASSSDPFDSASPLEPVSPSEASVIRKALRPQLPLRTSAHARYRQSAWIPRAKKPSIRQLTNS